MQHIFKNVNKILLILILSFFIIGGLEKAGYVFYIMPYIAYPDILVKLSWITALLFCIFKLFPARKPVYMYILVLFVPLVIVINLMFTAGAVDSRAKYSEVTSPERSHQLVFYEYDNGVAICGIIYEKINPVFIKQISSYLLNKSTPYPVATKRYSIQWNEYSFILSYSPLPEDKSGTFTQITTASYLNSY